MPAESNAVVDELHERFDALSGRGSLAGLVDAVPILRISPKPLDHHRIHGYLL